MSGLMSKLMFKYCPLCQRGACLGGVSVVWQWCWGVCLHSFVPVLLLTMARLWHSIRASCKIVPGLCHDGSVSRVASCLNAPHCHQKFAKLENIHRVIDTILEICINVNI